MEPQCFRLQGWIWAVVDVLDSGTRTVTQVKLALLDMRNSCSLISAESL